MHATLHAHQPLPSPDATAHCFAAGLITRYCSVTEAWLASIGKEIQDMFGPGDAEWRDLAADRQGIRCARRVNNNTDLRTCCEASSAGR
jgi:hypothetical protein